MMNVYMCASTHSHSHIRAYMKKWLKDLREIKTWRAAMAQTQSARTSAKPENPILTPGTLIVEGENPQLQFVL